MTIAIGDLQGCLSPLDALLARSQPGADEAIWFCGDLVNRGPDSLGTLRRVAAMGAKAITVLGNHDLHLLAALAGARQMRRSDTMQPITSAPDRQSLTDWLRRRPLAVLDGDYLLVHAGVVPSWTARDAVELGAEVSRVLAGPDWGDFMQAMYGNTPDRWDDSLTGDDRLRVIVNVLTRIRMIDPQGRMDFEWSDAPAKAPRGLIPWFDAPGRRSVDRTIVFGHWSTLGLISRPDLVSLDTGCVWGGCLSAMRLESRRLFQTRCPPRPARD